MIKNMDCFQPIPKPKITETIVETAAKYFGIEDENEKCNLRLFFDFYADFKIQENLINAFSKPPCERE